MRFILVLISILILEVSTVWADILSVSGYLKQPSRVSVGEVQVKLVHGTKKIKEAISKSITPSKSYRINLENVEYTLSCFVTCEEEYNNEKFVAATKQKLKFERETFNTSTGEIIMWVAEVQDLQLYS